MGDLSAQEVGEHLEVAVGSDLHGGVGPDRVLQAGRRVEGHDAPLIDDGDAIAELVGLLHVVRGEEDRLPVDVQLAEDLPQRDPALGIEASSGFIEEQHRRSVHHRSRHHEPLGHAT